MHIALLTDGIYPIIMGGMQKHSFYLAKYLARKEVHVDVYHALPRGETQPSRMKGFTQEELNFLTFFPVTLPASKKYPGHYIVESYRYSEKVYQQFILQSQPDFVYIQGFAGWNLLAHNPQEKERRISTAINFHGVEMFQKASDFKAKLEHLMLRPFVKWNLKHSDTIFSLGGKLTLILKKIAPGNNIIEIPIGITSDWIVDHPPPNKKRTFVFVGRYERRKGIDELNTVLKQICNDNAIPFEFHFIGPIPVEKQLETESFANIHYHGSIQDEKHIQSILAQSDILVCPSWSEGMPTVILEGMASGCAIIASDVGAVDNQVSEENGILVAPGNIDQLRNAMLEMIRLDPGKLHRMQKTSIEKIKMNFLWEEVVEKTLEKIR